MPSCAGRREAFNLGMSRAKPAADRSNERRPREMRMRALSSAPAAVRMRLHRKRRREGTHYVRIPLESFEIEGLIRLKVLPKAHREDADALQAAVLTLVYQALDGAG